MKGTWDLEGGSYTGGFEREVEEGSTNGASFSKGLHKGDLEGGFLYWRPGRISLGLEMGVCFHRARLWETWGGGLCSFLGPWREGKTFFIYRNFYEGFKRYAKKNPCKWFSLSIVVLLENLDWVCLVGLFERKGKVYLGSFLGPRGYYDFKSGCHLEL